MTDTYLMHKAYFGQYYWPKYYWPGFYVEYVEKLNFTVTMNRAVTDSTIMNVAVSRSAIMNTKVNGDYQELEQK